MTSVLELLGIRERPTSTPIPRLGVNNRINTLQLKSQKYFTIGDNAAAADLDILAVSVSNSFALSNSDHITFLGECTALFKEKSKELKAIDYKIMSGLIVGIVAASLSFLPVIGFLSFVGWGAALYYMSQREKAYDEYHESLTLLVGACNWSLGQGPKTRSSDAVALTENQDIRNMMTELYPVLTDTQVKHLIADDIEDNFSEEQNKYESKFKPGFFASTSTTLKDENIALSKRGAEFNRCVYGFNKANAVDFIDAFISAFPDLYNAAVHGCARLKHWWDNRNATPTPTATPTVMSVA